MNVELSSSDHPATFHIKELKQEIARFFERELVFLTEERQNRARALGINSVLMGKPRPDLRRA